MSVQTYDETRRNKS